MIRRLVVGNWKMHAPPDSGRFLAAVAAGTPTPGPDVVICPPATHLAVLAANAPAGDAVAPVGLGGQDCHPAPSGAHTGDIAAEMLHEYGASHVIVGHSERRADHGERDAEVAAKAQAAWRAGLVALVCVGESAADRDRGDAEAVVRTRCRRSLPDGARADNTVLAYEPIWAIGTGRTASTGDIGAMHAMLRAELVRRFGPAGRAFRILYGGSVNPANAAGILAVEDVDGTLVGGASLQAESFLAIIRAAA